MGLKSQLHAAGLLAFPCRVAWDSSAQKWKKHPVTVDHEAWSKTGARSPDDPALRWDAYNVYGVVIPEGVVVIDLDSYKGIDEAGAAAALGAAIPFADATIQTTIGGGTHYAFRAPEWPVKQLDNITRPGLDTRVGGKGFICTGEGYVPTSPFGVYAMLTPELLPVIPDECRPVLEAVQTVHSHYVEKSDVDVSTVIDALKCIDPTPRENWRDVGFALKNQYGDSAFELWNRFSYGEFWPDGMPHNYVSDSQQSQWDSFKAESDSGATVHIGTLFYRAIRGGWRPPAQFDASAAFGTGGDADAFRDVLTEITESGADSSQTDRLLSRITGSSCNELQALLLRNELKAAMRSAKILDKDLTRYIDRAVSPVKEPVEGVYGPNDTDNARLFLNTHYPGGSLIKCDGEYFWYTGKAWQRLTADMLKNQVARSMEGSRPQNARISGCTDTVSRFVDVHDGSMQTQYPGIVIFQNGVLNIQTGELMPHHRGYMTTNILPYDYQPGATCPNWLLTINQTLDGDRERIDLLQEWIGYQFTTEIRFHKLLLMIGPPRCGKSTIGKTIALMVGEDNYTGASLSSFAKDSFLDSLHFKTSVFVGDARKRVPAHIEPTVVERIMQITGGDEVNYSRKWLSDKSVTMPTKITIAANGLPGLFDDSGALAGRMMALPFYNSWFGNEDHYLFDRLAREIPGICIWALEGLRRLYANGKFTIGAASQDESAQVAEMYSPLLNFIAECCQFGDGLKVHADVLYTAYRQWAQMNSEKLMTPRQFTSAFRDVTRGRRLRYASVRIGDEVRRGYRGVSITGSGVDAAFINN